MKKLTALKKRSLRAVNKPTKKAAVAAEHGILSDAMRLWVSKNRNIQTTIATSVPCSPQFVNMVIKGARRHEKVERLLREAGAPIHG